MVGSAEGVLLKQSWEVEAMLLSKQGVKKTNLKERKYRATSKKNEGKETDETEMRLV